MAIEDYIPNIFGGGMPSYLPGLLGEEETAALQKRANVQGLLGAAITLAGGMAPYGPRRTAAQNVLGALAGGFQAGQGAYQGAMQNFAIQQQMADAKLKREKAMMDLEGMRQFKEKYPDLFPIAAIDAKEAASAAAQTEAFKPIQAIYSGIGQPTGQAMPQQVSQGAPSVQGPAVGPDGMIAPVDVDPQTEEKIFPPNPVVAKKTAVRINELIGLNKFLQEANTRLLGVRGGAKMIEDNNKLIEANRKEIGGITSAEFDFEGLKKQVPDQLKPFVDRIESLAFSGVMQPKEVNDAIAKVQESAFDFKRKQEDITQEAIRIARGEFGKTLDQLSQEEIKFIDNKIQQKDLEGRKAGATNLNVSVAGEKEMFKERGKEAVKAEGAAFSAMNAAGDVRAIVDVLKPYRGGPLDQFQASIGAYLPGTQANKLATAAQLADSIRQRLAPTIRVEGSGATSDFEARSYLNAIPSLMNTAEGRELMAVYAERFANRAAAAADIRAQMVVDGKFSVRRFQEELKKQGLTQILSPEDLKILRGEQPKASPSIAPGVTVRKVR